MLLSYLRLSIRLLIRSPFFTFLNVLGLSVGFAVFLVLWHYAERQLASDQHYKNADRIVRLTIDLKWTDDGKKQGHLRIGTYSSSVTHKITRDLAGVESSLRLLHQRFFQPGLTGHGSQIILSNEQNEGSTPLRFKETQGVYADPNLFEFFSIPLILGESNNVLKEPNSIVLSRSTANKYFGKKNPVGELLVLNGILSLKVTGVFEDLADNTHLEFDFVISNTGREKDWNTVEWGNTTCYARLAHATPADLETNINARIPHYFAAFLRENPHIQIKIVLQPLTDVAFNHELLNNNFSAKSKLTLMVLQGVSVAILLMAWANYINLTISRTARRMKEVATRKISGAFTGDFAKQFILEACTLNLIALGFAITLIQFMREPFDRLLEIPTPEITSIPISTLCLSSLIIILGIVFTGVYPAIVSSSLNPRLLFLLTSKPSRKRLLPSVLTTAQYASAMALIFCAVVINHQLKFILNKDLGFDKDHVLLIDAPTIRDGNYVSDLTFFRNELLKEEHVRNVTFSTAWINFGIKLPLQGIHIDTDGYGVNENYIPLYDIPFLAGRNFQPDDKRNAVIVTRFVTERLNFDSPHEAIGSRIMTSPQDNHWTEMEIIGVVENFRTTPFYSSLDNTEVETGRGVTFVYGHNIFNKYPPETIAVKLDGMNLPLSVKQMENKFSAAFEGNLFIASFLDQRLNETYFTEELIKNQLTFFTFLAIGIACLGLFGMVSNKVIEKKKEIGIRKALGAGIKNIGKLLIDTTIHQVLWAVVIAMPVAYVLSQHYLGRFTERITIHFWHFLFPPMLLVFVMLATVCLILVRAASSNPVDSLRHE